MLKISNYNILLYEICPCEMFVYKHSQIEHVKNEATF